MGTAKLTAYIIGVAVVGFIAIAIINFMSAVHTADSSITFTEGEFTTFSKQLNETSALSNELKGKVLNITQASGLFDIVGGYFSAGWGALKVSAKSLETGVVLTNEAVTRANLGTTGANLIALLVTGLVVAIVVGIFLYAIVKV